MIGSSHSQLCKKNSCSVKLQGGPLDYNPRKIPVENSWIIILQNNSKCLLLNDEQVPHEILFSLLQCWTKYKTERRWKHANRKKGELKKSNRNRVSCFNIYTTIIVFAFPLLCLTATTFIKIFMKSFLE